MGIATRFPSDAGISSDRSVVFFEGFERANWRNSWLEGNVRWRLRDLERVEGRDVALVGNAACKLVLKAGQLYGSMLGSGKRKPGWKTMHMRWYVRFSPGYKGGKHASITALDERTWVPGDAGKRPTGTDKAVFMVCLDGELRPQVYYYHLDQRGGYGSGGKQNVGGTVALETGRWHCLELAVGMNDPGERNGWQKLWVNGQLKGEWKDLRWRTAESLNWNSWSFLIGSNDKAPGEQFLLVDNVVVATGYIGPMVKRPVKVARKEGESVWKLIAEKERARQAGDGSAGEAVRLAKAGDYAAAAAAYEGRASGGGKDAERFLSMAHVLKRVGELREWIVDGVNAGREPKTYVDIMGVRLRGKVVSADEARLTVACMGNEVGLRWEELSPAKLFSLARKLAAGDEQEELLRALRKACGMED